jgi:hypothetical protein
VINFSRDTVLRKQNGPSFFDQALFAPGSLRDAITLKVGLHLHYAITKRWKKERSLYDVWKYRTRSTQTPIQNVREALRLHTHCPEQFTRKVAKRGKVPRDGSIELKLRQLVPYG